MVLWHPDADRRPVFGRPGKPWSGGAGNPKYLFHTTEITTRWPNYTTPPHLTLNPWTGELRQHVAFNLAAYAVRSGRVDTMRFTYQVEHWGRAKAVPTYPDVWYQNVAELIQWCHDNLNVPLVFDDFTNLRFGAFGSRLPYADVDAFSGIIGHGRVGRGIDTHWDPGALDVPRLETMLTNMEDDMGLLPMQFGDGYPEGTELSFIDVRGDEQTITTTELSAEKRSDVRWLQELLNDAGVALFGSAWVEIGQDGKYGEGTTAAVVLVTPRTAVDSAGFVFHGNDMQPTMRAAFQNPGPKGDKGDPGAPGMPGPAPTAGKISDFVYE